MRFAILPDAQLCFFKKGDYLIREGEKVEYIYYLVDGYCYGTSLTQNGLETIYYTKSIEKLSNSLIGVLVLYANGLSITNFIAKTDCICYKIPSQTVLNCISTDSDLLQELLKLSMESYYRICGTFRSRQEHSAVKDVSNFLLEKSYIDKGILTVPRSYSNAEISRFLGMHPMTVSKILTQLKKLNIITRRNNRLVILEKEELLQYALGEKKLTYRFKS